jgi:hypothetical protein
MVTCGIAHRLLINSSGHGLGPSNGEKPQQHQHYAVIVRAGKVEPRNRRFGTLVRGVSFATAPDVTS